MNLKLKPFKKVNAKQNIYICKDISFSQNECPSFLALSQCNSRQNASVLIASKMHKVLDQMTNRTVEKISKLKKNISKINNNRTIINIKELLKEKEKQNMFFQLQLPNKQQIKIFQIDQKSNYVKSYHQKQKQKHLPLQFIQQKNFFVQLKQNQKKQKEKYNFLKTFQTKDVLSTTKDITKHRSNSLQITQRSIKKYAAKKQRVYQQILSLYSTAKLLAMEQK